MVAPSVKSFDIPKPRRLDFININEIIFHTSLMFHDALYPSMRPDRPDWQGIDPGARSADGGVREPLLDRIPFFTMYAAVTPSRHLRTGS
jgi:hypothetical protein